MPLKEAVEKTETDGKDGDDGKVKYVTVHYSRTARPRLDFYSNLTLLKKKKKNPQRNFNGFNAYNGNCMG